MTNCNQDHEIHSIYQLSLFIISIFLIDMSCRNSEILHFRQTYKVISQKNVSLTEETQSLLCNGF
jgi:hypothetical protein